MRYLLDYATPSALARALATLPVVLAAGYIVARLAEVVARIGGAQ